MTEIRNLAEATRKELKLKYNSDSIKYLEGFIERTKVTMDKDKWNGLITSCGAFLGECVIRNFGGEWGKDYNGMICVKFDEKNIAYPFAKVEKQFENGLGDSIHSFYTVIPTFFGIKKNERKNKWWKF